MSRLTGRVEKLEEQTGAAGGTPLCLCYQAEGVFEVNGAQYASQEEARAAHPASLFICLPMSRNDERTYYIVREVEKPENSGGHGI